MINEEIARCIAKLSGDGNVYVGKKGTRRYARYSNTCETLRTRFKLDIRKIFGNIHLTEGVTNTGTSFVQTNRTEIVDFFLKYLTSYKSKDIFIPIEIKKASNSIKSAYLQALYDDEGSPRLRIAKKLREWKRNISLSSNSIQVIRDAKEMLEQDFGIFCNRIYENMQFGKNSSFVIEMTGKKNFELFKKHISFEHPKKKKIISLMLESYGKTPKRNPKGCLSIEKKIKFLKQYFQSSHRFA